VGEPRVMVAPLVAPIPVYLRTLNDIIEELAQKELDQNWLYGPTKHKKLRHILAFKTQPLFGIQM